MKLEFELPIKAFSINSYHYANRKIKTKEAREWEQKVLSLINYDTRNALADIRKHFEHMGGSFRLQLEFQYPREVYYNKDEEISARTFDLSNVEKPIMDLIFLQTMKIDDRFVDKLTSKKKAGDKYNIKIRILYLPTTLVSGKVRLPTKSLP